MRQLAFLTLALALAATCHGWPMRGRPAPQAQAQTQWGPTADSAPAGGRGSATMMGGGGWGGMGMGGGMMGGGRGWDNKIGASMDAIHNLMSSYTSIRRTTKNIPSGVVAQTESDDPAVAAWIKQHVADMTALMAQCAGEGGCPGRMPRWWDPLFAAVYKSADKIELEVMPTSKGVRVKETGKDARAAMLVQAHARVVSAFAARGMNEAMTAHEVPGSAASERGSPSQ